MLRTYLDWLVELPWASPTEEPIDIDEARAHPRRRPLRSRQGQAAHPRVPRGAQAQSRRQDVRSCASSARPASARRRSARASRRRLGRKFARLSLGGVHDEAEIRGHRRTYIGAMPGQHHPGHPQGRHAQLRADAGRDRQARPSACTATRRRRCSRCSIPSRTRRSATTTSACRSTCRASCSSRTANVLDRIPGPLRDRMEVIELPGYTEAEKLEIARRYLVQAAARGDRPAPEQVEITDAALRVVIGDYTREAGVRNLEREIGNLFRHAAMQIAEGAADAACASTSPTSRRSSVRARFENEVAMRTSVPGVATGLAWTPVGGDILFIEASRTPGSGKLILTGQLGDVMKESAQAALTLVKARAAGFGIDPAVFEKSDMHMHIPAGAIPKDGPSAGVAMFIVARLAAARPAGASRRRDDRRDQPARSRAADRRRQGEGAGGVAGRHHHGDAARAQPARPRGHPRRRPRGSSRSCGSRRSTTPCGTRWDSRSANGKPPPSARRKRSVSRPSARGLAVPCVSSRGRRRPFVCRVFMELSRRDERRRTRAYPSAIGKRHALTLRTHDEALPRSEGLGERHASEDRNDGSQDGSSRRPDRTSSWRSCFRGHALRVAPVSLPDGAVPQARPGGRLARARRGSHVRRPRVCLATCRGSFDQAHRERGLELQTLAASR